MPTTAKIQVRSGVLADLPILAASEFGYAKDSNRLFIGNDPVTRTGTGSTIDFGVDLDGLAGTYTIKTNGNVETSFTVDNTVVTFTTPPSVTDTVILYYNTEVYTIQPDSGLQLPIQANPGLSAGTNQATGLVIDGRRFNWVEIEYTLKHTTEIRNGKIVIGLNGDSNTDPTDFTLTDTYNSKATGSTLDHIFSGSLSTQFLSLDYTSTDTTQTGFNYIVKSWQAV